MRDKQTVRDLAIRFLTSQLMAEGIQVAAVKGEPGIHLRANFEGGGEGQGPFAYRIRMSASTKPRFRLDREYGTSHNLLFVYVWNEPSSSEAIIHALTYKEAFELLSSGRTNHTLTDSWVKQGGGYSIPNINDEWGLLLEPYRMKIGTWKKRFFSVLPGADYSSAH